MAVKRPFKRDRFLFQPQPKPGERGCVQQALGAFNGHIATPINR